MSDLAHMWVPLKGTGASEWLVCVRCGKHAVIREDALCPARMPEAAARIQSLEEENERLKAALKPFAAIAPTSFCTADGNENESYQVIAFEDRCDFTGADLRRAREAIGE